MYDNWTNNVDPNGFNNQRLEQLSSQQNRNVGDHQQTMYSSRNKNDLNSLGENEIWECNICHKIFHLRKGYYQHINSNTHQPIKHSCSLCGKGFASLGSLALHNEQASHAFLNDGEKITMSNANKTLELSKSVSSNLHVSSQAPQFAGPQKSFKHLPNNNYSSERNSFANVNDFQTNHNSTEINNYSSVVRSTAMPARTVNVNMMNEWYPNQFEQGGRMSLSSSHSTPFSAFQGNSNVTEMSLMSTTFELYVGGLVDFPSKVGALGWAIGDVSHDAILFQHAVSFVDCQWTTEQLEYQALIRGLHALHSKGMKNIKIFDCSQLVMSHLMNNPPASPSDAVKYFELELFKAEVLPLFPLFDHITFEMDYVSEYVLRVIKKKISDCIIRLNCTNGLPSNSGSSFTNSASYNSGYSNHGPGVDNIISLNPPVVASYASSDQFQATQSSYPQTSSMWSSSATDRGLLGPIGNNSWMTKNNVVSTDTSDSVTMKGGGRGVTHTTAGPFSLDSSVTPLSGVLSNSNSSNGCVWGGDDRSTTTKTTTSMHQEPLDQEVTPFYAQSNASQFHVASSRFNLKE